MLSKLFTSARGACDDYHYRAYIDQLEEMQNLKIQYEILVRKVDFLERELEARLPIPIVENIQNRYINFCNHMWAKPTTDGPYSALDLPREDEK